MKKGVSQMAVTHFNDVPVCGQVAKKNPLQTTGNMNDVTCKKCLKVLSNMSLPDTVDLKPDAVDPDPEVVDPEPVEAHSEIEDIIKKDFKEAEDQLNEEKMHNKLDISIDEVEVDDEVENDDEIDAIIDSFTFGG